MCAHRQLEAQADETAGQFKVAITDTCSIGAAELQATAASSVRRERLLQVGREVAEAIWAGERRAWQLLLEDTLADVISQAAHLADADITAAARPQTVPWGASMPFFLYLELAALLCLRALWHTVVAPALAAKDRLRNNAAITRYVQKGRHDLQKPTWGRAAAVMWTLASWAA